MTDRAELLAYAEQVLDGRVSLGARGPRTAALLARRAFEDWLDEVSTSWVFPERSSAARVLDPAPQQAAASRR